MAVTIGSVRQGSATPTGLWRPGDRIDARRVSTMFFADMSEKLSPDLVDHEIERFMRSLGYFVVEVSSVGIPGWDNTRVAGLSIVEGYKRRYDELMARLFAEDPDGYGPTTCMTLPEGCVLKVGNQITVSYLTVLEPSGEGEYTLRHDYAMLPIQGPRFEPTIKYKDQNENATR